MRHLINSFNPSIALTFGFFMLALSGFSQESDLATSPYIDVIGYAEKWVVPDEIYLTIGIRERESGRDKITVEEQETQLLSALQALNIPLENLAVAEAQADYVRVKYSRKDVISQSKYELKLTNAQEVADVFKKLDELKIDKASISHVSHSKLQEFQKEVNIEAIVKAKAKADYLLVAIGQKTGTTLVVNIQDNGNALHKVSGVDKNELKWMFFNLEDQSEIKTDLSFKKIKLESMVYVKFAIE